MIFRLQNTTDTHLYLHKRILNSCPLDRHSAGFLMMSHPPALSSSSCGYLHAVTKQPYFHVLDVIEMTTDSPDQDLHDLVCSYSQRNYVAFALKNNLTISKLTADDSLLPGGESSSSSDEIIDLEFDGNILILCWDQQERCLIVADDNGSLHLVTTSGQILFSKKITSGTPTLVSSPLTPL
jgi:hypothetical protein